MCQLVGDEVLCQDRAHANLESDCAGSILDRSLSAADPLAAVFTVDRICAGRSELLGRALGRVGLRRPFDHGVSVPLAARVQTIPFVFAGLSLLLKGHQPSATVSSESFRITRSLPHGHVEAVLRVVRTLGLDRLLGSKQSRERNLGLAMVVARILHPGSKLATARSLDCQTLSSTLAQECHLEGSIHENELYAALDWLVSRQARIEKALATRHLEEGCLVLYDLTSSYLEGKCCQLASLGFNRDGKVGKLQIEYGLLCNKEGCPVAVEVFEGNTADPMTLGSQIKKVRERFGLKRVVIVGDRGMITQARIEQELRGIEGLEWIGSLRSSQIAGLLEEGAIAPSLFDEKNLAEISSPDFPNERLIACRNPFLAQYRRAKREALLRATVRAHVFLCMLAYYLEWHMRKA